MNLLRLSSLVLLASLAVLFAVSIAGAQSDKALVKAVEVVNFPDPQDVIGSVEVSNLPAVQDVSVTNTPLAVDCQGQPQAQFLGLSEAITTGAIGRFGLNGLCADEFGAGARMCEFAEVQTVTPQPAGEGWLNEPVYDCGNWTGTSGTGRTMVFQLPVGGRLISGTRNRICSNEISVSCCR